MKDINKISPDLINKQLTYPEICQIFNFKPATGKQKILQIEKVADICDIEKIPNSSRYIINKFYNEEEKALIQYLKAPQQQLLFDKILYNEFFCMIHFIINLKIRFHD